MPLGTKDAYCTLVLENDDKGKDYKSGRKSHIVLEKNCLREERLKMIAHYGGG